MPFYMAETKNLSKGAQQMTIRTKAGDRTADTMLLGSVLCRADFPRMTVKSLTGGPGKFGSILFPSNFNDTKYLVLASIC